MEEMLNKQLEPMPDEELKGISDEQLQAMTSEELARISNKQYVLRIVDKQLALLAPLRKTKRNKLLTSKYEKAREFIENIAGGTC